MKNILLTGIPGVGKTTVIEKILSEISLKAGGFYTQELRRGKMRMGFRIVTTDGEEGVLAHRDFKSKWRVGKYGVHIEEMERVGVASLDLALHERDLIVIDEIGKMELYSKQFQKVNASLPISQLLLVTTNRLRPVVFVGKYYQNSSIQILK